MVSTPRGLQLVQPRDRVGVPLGLVAPDFGIVGGISVDMMNTCSCMSVTPRSVVSMAPRAVFRLGTPPMLGRGAVAALSRRFAGS